MHSSRFSVQYSRVKRMPSRSRWAKLFSLGAITALFVLSLAQRVNAATLTHRYSFDTDASDSVGGADGTLIGNAVVADGALDLDGTNSCVQLPDDLFTNYDSISFELWYADAPVSNPFNELYHFSGAGGAMSFLLFGQASNVVGISLPQSPTLMSPPVGGTNHLIITEDSVAQTANIYLNGILAATFAHFTMTPSAIGSTATNYIGAGNTNLPSSNFKGSILEFRAYQGALSPLDAAVLDAFGPDQPQTDPGTLQDVRIVIPSSVGPGALLHPGVFADFSNVTNVNITGQPDLILSSDNTNSILVGTNGSVRSMNPGTADLTALWQGLSNTVAVTVSVPQDISLVHRYGFNEQTNDWIVHDSVGNAHGRLFNTGTHSPTNGVFTGAGEMALSGGYSSGGGTGGYAVLPPGIISSQSEVTIEAWVTWTSPASLPLTYGFGAWQRIFDFGSQISGTGVNYLFLTPATDNVSFTTQSLLHSAITTNGNVRENPRLNWTNALPRNVQSQVVIAYSPVRGVMKMYLNGVPVASGVASIPLSGIVDTNCLLGKSLFASDAYFFGRFNEFRIYSGLLTDQEVAAEYSAGPDALGVDYVLRGYPSGDPTTNSMIVSWGTSASNVVLQSSPALGSTADWNPVPNSPILLNGRLMLTVPVVDDAEFFRLHTP